MKHQAIKLYKVCIENDPGMTLTYFMARSAEVAYSRSQVSVYRTIGPLVLGYGILTLFILGYGIFRNFGI